MATTVTVPRWPSSLLNAIRDPRERHLLECTGEIFGWLKILPQAEAILVREVLAIIISGQRLDLERFAGASRENPLALSDDAALDDYTWRVAGCVGAFWTKLGFLTLGENFSKSPQAELLEQGVAYGKGLQLVNVLRDLPADLATGRCYLPVKDPKDPDELLACHARWLERALAQVGEGEVYSKQLRSRRLRAASVLPALIARKTLEELRGVSLERLQSRIKIRRAEIYKTMLQALLIRPS